MAGFRIHIPTAEEIASIWEKSSIETLKLSFGGIFVTGLLTLLAGPTLFTLSRELCSIVGRVTHGSALALAITYLLEMTTTVVAEVCFSDKSCLDIWIRIHCGLLVMILQSAWLLPTAIRHSCTFSILVVSVMEVLIMMPVEFSLGWILSGMLIAELTRLRSRMEK